MKLTEFLRAELDREVDRSRALRKPANHLSRALISRFEKQRPIRMAAYRLVGPI